MAGLATGVMFGTTRPAPQFVTECYLVIESQPRPKGIMATAAKRKTVKVDEPSPASLMERLAALQREFAKEVKASQKK